MKRYSIIVLILFNLFVVDIFCSPDYCTPGSNCVGDAKNALMSAKNEQKQLLLNPTTCDLDCQKVWQRHIKRCHDELMEIKVQLKKWTKQHYLRSQLSSIGDIEDRQLMKNTCTLFKLVANKLKNVNEGFQKEFGNLPQNHDQFVKRRIKTLVAQAQKGIFDAQCDLEYFFGIVKDGKYVKGKHESVDLQRVWKCFSKNYPDGVPSVVSEWAHVLCNWYNVWFAGDKPIAVPVLKTGSNGDTETSDATSKFPSYPPLKAAAWIEEQKTNKDSAIGGTADILRNIADYRNGNGGPTRKSWEYFKNKMKQTLEPSQQNGMIKRFVKRLISAAINQTARVARWIVVKTCFKRGTFDRKPWQETKAGQCLDEMERGWTGRQEEEKPPRSWWLKRLFIFNWRTT
ncbi:hypothetical protein E3J79_04425 [Candidatus Dependentiae bacterium]|nr:MAG: hypothetical protein E3J79_04425 [Candidatus Dependentiae bacterium]